MHSAVHRWSSYCGGPIQSPGSGPKMYLNQSACQFSCSHALGISSQAAPTTRVSSTLLPKWDAKPTTLPSFAAGEGHGQFFYSHNPFASSPVSHIVMDEGGKEGVPPSSTPPPSRQEAGLVFLHSAQPPQPGPALLCCPGEVQGLLSILCSKPNIFGLILFNIRRNYNWL